MASKRLWEAYDSDDVRWCVYRECDVLYRGQRQVRVGRHWQTRTPWLGRYLTLDEAIASVETGRGFSSWRANGKCLIPP